MNPKFYQISNQLSGGLLQLFLAIVGNYIGDVVSKDFQYSLDTDFTIKYIVMFAVLYISIFSSMNNNNERILYSFAILGWYYMLRNAPFNRTILVVTLCVKYIAEQYLSHLKKNKTINNQKYQKVVQNISYAATGVLGLITMYAVVTPLLLK